MQVLLLKSPCMSDIHSCLIELDISKQDIVNLAKSEKKTMIQVGQGVSIYRVDDNDKPAFVCNKRGHYTIYTGDYVLIDETLTGLTEEQLEYIRAIFKVQVAVRDTVDRQKVYGSYMVSVY